MAMARQRVEFYVFINETLSPDPFGADDDDDDDGSKPTMWI